jgi:hypothetical protein
MKQAKFSTLVDEKILEDLKNHSAESGKSISWLVTEAVAEYLSRTRTRPAFVSAMDEVLDRNADLLNRLAK